MLPAGSPRLRICGVRDGVPDPEPRVVFLHPDHADRQEPKIAEAFELAALVEQLGLHAKRTAAPRRRKAGAKEQEVSEAAAETARDQYMPGGWDGTNASRKAGVNRTRDRAPLYVNLYGAKGWYPPPPAPQPPCGLTEEEVERDRKEWIWLYRYYGRKRR